MIRWCSYCQKFLGEVPPFDAYSVSHGICDDCVARMGADGDDDASDALAEALVKNTQPIRDLMNRLFACASRGDASTIPSLLAEAVALDLSRESVLVGLLQPALYRAGKEWQVGGMSVAEEHRLTLWCDRFFGQLPFAKRSPEVLNLLVFLAPNNAHSLGPRFAADILTARGFSAEAIVPEIPLAEMVAEIERLRPRVVGFSCALPSSLPAVDALVIELERRVDPSWRRRFLVSGLALRGPDAEWRSLAGACVAVTIDDAERFLLAARATSSRPVDTSKLA